MFSQPDAFRDSVEIGERPLCVKYHGEYALCDEVRGLAEQFYGKVKDFALQQNLSQYWKYFDLPMGGYVKAQYGPNKLQVIDVYRSSEMPGVGKEKEEEKFPEIKHEYDENHCRTDVFIALETDEGAYPADAPDAIYGRYDSHPVIQHIGKGYPEEYEIYMYVDSEDEAGNLYRTGFFFEVVAKEVDKETGRHLPVTLPFPCFQCYEWELESELGECDGQLISTAEMLAAIDYDMPCDLDEERGVVYNYQGFLERQATGNGKGTGEPDYKQEGTMRWKPGIRECSPHDGTYAWFINVQFEPYERCPPETMTLRLYDKGKKKLLHSVVIHIVKVMDQWVTSHWSQDNTDPGYSSSGSEHTNVTHHYTACGMIAQICVDVGGWTCDCNAYQIHDLEYASGYTELWAHTVNTCTGESDSYRTQRFCGGYSYWIEYYYYGEEQQCSGTYYPLGINCNLANIDLADTEIEWEKNESDNHECYVPPTITTGYCCG